MYINSKKCVFVFIGPPSWINPTVPKPIFTDYREPSSSNNDRYGRFNPFPRPPIEVKPSHENPYDAIRKLDRPNRPMVPGLMDGPLKSWRAPPKENNIPPFLVAASNTEDNIVTNPTTEVPVLKSRMTLNNFLIAAGVAFLLINVFLFTFIFYKKSRARSLERQTKQINTCSNGDLPGGDNNCFEKGVDEVDANTKSGCNVFKIIKSSDKTKPDDYYEPVRNNVFDGSKTPKSDDSGGFGQRFKLRRHMSNSTLDAHTKVRDWIAHEIVQRCSPRFLRKTEDPKVEPRHLMNSNLVNVPYNKNTVDEISKDIPKPNCKIGSLTGSLRAPTDSTASAGFLEKKLHMNNDKNKNTGSSKKSSKRVTGSGKSSKPSNSTKSTKSKHSNEKNASDGSLRRKNKPEKVSVAIDATPGTRSSSVLKQQPIEFSKSLDYCCYIDDGMDVSTSTTPMRRSQTVEDFVKRSSYESLGQKDNVFKSSVNLKVSVNNYNEKPSEVIQITHKHSRSDPVKDINYADMFTNRLPPKQPGSFHTFSTIQPPAAFRNDINVTSREDGGRKIPMTPEESLMNMKRRNYPKVLPDLPRTGEGISTMAQKRLSLPPQNHLLLFPTSEESSVSNSEASTPTELKSFYRNPPLPPPRTSSTLGRRNQHTIAVNSNDLINARHNISSHYVEMCTNTLPNSVRFNSNHSDMMQLYAQVKNKPKNRVNMLDLESDMSQSDQTDSERDEDTPHSSYEVIKPRARVIVTANPNEPVQVIDPKVIIRPVINRNPSSSRQTNIPRVVARDNSFDKSDMKTFVSNKPHINVVTAEQRHDTADAKIERNNPTNRPELKINIPVYIPDTKGPSTPNELERSKLKHTHHESKPENKPKTSVDAAVKAKQIPPTLSDTKPTDSNREENIKNSKSEKKASSMSRSNSNSKIPKTPTMAAKHAKKDVRVQQSPKASKTKPSSKILPSKTSAIPQPVQHQKSSDDSNENDHSTSESSNGTECSTGTVKKITK